MVIRNGKEIWNEKKGNEIDKYGLTGSNYVSELMFKCAYKCGVI